MMALKKSVSLLLVVSQLISLSVFAETTATATPAPSPEFVLLRDTIALEGMALTQAEAEKQLEVAFTQYLATAQADGQVERLGQALVDLNITTPMEASAIVADAQGMNTGLNENVSSQRQNEIVTQSILQLVASHPLMGAQFSTGCEVGGAIVLSGIGLFAFVEIAAKAGMSFGSRPFAALSDMGMGVVIAVAGGVVMAATCFRGA